MTESSISQVGRLDPEITSKMIQEVAVQLERQTKPVENPAFAQELVKFTKTEPKPGPEKGKSNEPSALNKTALRFRVDMETHKVTIMIVDKATDKVIATVPPEAIKDIPSGQLLEYSA